MVGLNVMCMYAVKFTVSENSLPIKLLSFTRSFISSNRFHLDWQTISEINDHNFFVQKFNETSNEFETVSDLIQSAGYFLEPQYYEWTDSTALTGAVSNEIQYRLKQIDNDGLIHYHGPITVTMSPTGIKDNSTIPTEFGLSQNYPNPFNPSTMINYQLPIKSNVTLKVFDVLGKEVATLVDRYKEVEYHSVKYDATKLSTGIYFYRLAVNSIETNQIEKFVDIKKILMK